jgi:hypothetical protein
MLGLGLFTQVPYLSEGNDMLALIKEAEAIVDVTSIEYHGGKTFIYFMDHSGKINSFNIIDNDKSIFKKIWEGYRKLGGVLEIPAPDGSMQLTENCETYYD